MRFVVLAATFSLLPVIAFAQFGVEDTRNLGFGFRYETHAEPTNSSFESITHQAYLYYGDRKLCNVGEYSIAPSGRFAIYQDGPSGTLFLFRRADGKIFQLTPKSIGFPETFVWHERVHTVEVHLEHIKTPAIFQLP